MKEWPIETWLGVLGFVMSACLTIIEAVKSRRHIKIKYARIVPMIHNVDNPYIYAVLTLLNSSSMPKPIYHIEITLFGRFVFQSRHESIVIIKLSNEKTGSAMLCSTRLPFTLAPYSAEDIVVLFPLQSSTESGYLHRALRNNHQEPQSIPVRFRVATLPRGLDCEISADLANYRDEAEIVKRFRRT